VIFLAFAVYGALRHPILTVTAWWETYQAYKHPRTDLPEKPHEG